MMNNNVGDHNALSKWLLGWLPDSKITRFIVSEDQIMVKQGQEVVTQLSKDAGDELSVEQAVQAFNQEGTGGLDTGGVLVVSTTDDSMLSSYYLLQYDSFAGNNSVYSAKEGARCPLPSGFRMFRVQAQLTEGNVDYAHPNALGRVFDQMIELVDPDMDEIHFGGAEPNDVECAHSSTGYGCMLYAGSKVTPVTYPSTNFYENALMGFTGIQLEVLESEADYGLVRVSCTDEGKPDQGTTLDISPVQADVSTVGTLVLQQSTPANLNPMMIQSVDLVVDGIAYPQYGISVSKGQITLPYTLNPNEIQSGSTCQLVFPAGLFELGQTPEGTRYSSEITVDLATVPAMTKIAKTSSLPDASYHDDCRVSDVIAGFGETRVFYQVANGQLRQGTVINQEAPDAQMRDVTCADDANETTSFESCNGIHPFALMNDDKQSADQSLLVLSFENHAPRAYIVDNQSATIVSSYNLDSAAFADVVCAEKAADGANVVLVSTYRGANTGAAQGSLLTLCELGASGTVQEHYGWTKAERLFNAGLGTIAAPNAEVQADGKTVTVGADITSVGDLVSHLHGSVASAGDAATYGDILNTVTKTFYSINHTGDLLDATYANGGTCFLLSAESEDVSGAELVNGSAVTGAYRVTAFDSAGSLVYDNCYDYGMFGAPQKIQGGKNGALAVSRKNGHQLKPGTMITVTAVDFIDAQGSALSWFSMDCDCYGSWLSDGRWLHVGYPVDKPSGPAGSPVVLDAERSAGGSNAKALMAVVTDVIDDPSVNPQPTPDPQPVPDPATPDGGSGSDQQDSTAPTQTANAPAATARTSDPLPALCLVCVASALVAGLVIRRVRKQG